MPVPSTMHRRAHRLASSHAAATPDAVHLCYPVYYTTEAAVYDSADRVSRPTQGHVLCTNRDAHITMLELLTLLGVSISRRSI